MTYRSAGARSTTDPMLFAIMAFVFVAYLIVGLAMPVLPLYVRNNLGLSNFVVGFVAGTPSAAALLSRVLAGRYVSVSARSPRSSRCSSQIIPEYRRGRRSSS